MTSWRIVMPVLALALWTLVAVSGLVSPLFVPTPWAVFTTLGTMLVSGGLLLHTGATLGRALVGFAIASVLGIAAGIPVGYWRRAYLACEFAIDLMRSVPYTALFPLFLMFFGIGDVVKFAVCAWSAWLLVLVNTMYGVQHCSPSRRRVAQTFKASHLQILTKIVVPDAAPAIAAGLRTAISVTVQAAVVVEMFMGTTSVGLGQLIYNAAILFHAREMYAGIITAGIVGYGVNRGLVAIENRVLHWTRA